MSMIETIKKVNETLVRLIVDHPDEVGIEVSVTTKSVLVQIKVAKNDIGQVIGRSGKTINALTLISKAVKNTQFLGDKRDVFIEIIEDEKSDFQSKNLN